MTGSLIVDQGILALNSTNSVPFAKCPTVIGRSVADGTTAELRFLTHNQIADTNAVTVKQTGTLNLYGFNGATGPLTLSGGNVTTYAGTLTLASNVLTTNALASTISGNLYLGQAKRVFQIAPGSTLNIYA